MSAKYHRVGTNSPVHILEESSDDESTDDADYEQALSAAGYGRFHWTLLAVCGWANASDAIEVLCISFLLPAAECDLKLTSEDKGWLSAIVFVGMLVGGYVWGTLGDTFGRRRTLLTALLVNSACGFASSFSQVKSTFLFWRFLSGVGVGGSIPIVWAYFGEFQPKERRGRMLSYLAAFWMIGNVTVAVIAWIVIPLDLDVGSETVKYNSWRMFVLICSLPALIVAFALLKCPESPRYLLSKGREREAVNVLASIFEANTGKPKADYQIKRLSYRNGGIVNGGDVDLKHCMEETSKNTLRLFDTDLRRVTILMIFITFSIQFGYYGLWLWFPELFNKLSRYYAAHPEGEHKTVCQVTEFPAESPCPTNDPFCHCSEGLNSPENQVFVNSFIISLSALPGNVWTILQMDTLGGSSF